MLNEKIFGIIKELDLTSQAYLQSQINKPLSLEESLEILPEMWGQAYLRCTLLNLLDRFPNHYLEALALCGETGLAIKIATIMGRPILRNMDNPLFVLANLLRAKPQSQNFLRCFKGAIAHAQTSDSPFEKIKYLAQLGELAAEIGEKELAATLLEDAYTTVKLVNQDNGQSIAYRTCAKAFLRSGFPADAKRVLQEIKYDWYLYGEVEEFSELAVVFYQHGEQATAFEMLQKAEEQISKRASSERASYLAECLKFVLAAYAKIGQFTQARNIFRRIEKIYQENETNEPNVYYSAQTLALSLAALHDFEAAYRIVASLENNYVRFRSLIEITIVAVGFNQIDLAKIWLAEIVALFATIGNYAFVAKIRIFTNIVLPLQDWETAKTLIDLLENDPKSRNAARTLLARELARFGQIEEGRQFLEQVKPIEEPLNNCPSVLIITHLLAFITKEYYSNKENILRFEVGEAEYKQLAKILVDSDKLSEKDVLRIWSNYKVYPVNKSFIKELLSILVQEGQKDIADYVTSETDYFSPEWVETSSSKSDDLVELYNSWIQTDLEEVGKNNPASSKFFKTIYYRSGNLVRLVRTLKEQGKQRQAWQLLQRYETSLAQCLLETNKLDNNRLHCADVNYTSLALAYFELGDHENYRQTVEKAYKAIWEIPSNYTRACSGSLRQLVGMLYKIGDKDLALKLILRAFAQVVEPKLCLELLSSAGFFLLDKPGLANELLRVSVQIESKIQDILSNSSR
jgi:hypothetical protein